MRICYCQSAISGYEEDFFKKKMLNVCEILDEIKAII